MSQSAETQERFNEIVKKNQENIQKILSSNDPLLAHESTDSERQNEDIIEKLKASFQGGSSEDLGRTYQYLVDSLSNDSNICLICIDSIQKRDAIWNCTCCYSPFHIVCIQKWIKDGICQNILQSDVPNQMWHCPKCRTEFHQKNTPKRYLCYCQKEIDPAYDPWLLPHSCGQTCGKRLLPECGHICLLLCHPGPCPPCPKQVNVRCYCNQGAPTARRCGFKGWSCGKKCSKNLSCQQHSCEQLCHSGDCSPCQKTTQRNCLCGKTKTVRNCNDLKFKCDQTCGKLYNCRIHRCEQVCHEGLCGTCPRQGLRTCPCGKKKFENITCTEEVGTCGDTCDRKLDCGLHRCLLRCHAGDCETCRQVVTKRCRCSAKEKLVPCCQEFLCETKCTRLRSCGKHPCKRKCCDGNCPPCQNVCGKTLNCRNHKCLSECHRGQCYPCTEKAQVTCACGQTAITVPCGAERQTRRPRCNRLCTKVPDCHHSQRDPHLCHFDDCPDCKQICQLPLPNCVHLCPDVCHDYVLVKEEYNTSNTPWGLKEKFKLTKRSIPCAPCKVSVTVKCLGQHTTQSLPCSSAHPFCCGQQCKRVLSCQNHLCNLPCHLVTGNRKSEEAGKECTKCEEMCTKPRPDGCQHACPLNCHPGDCPPCKQRLRMRCHCNSQVSHTECNKYTTSSAEEKETIKSCGKPCTKKLICGHSCAFACHSGSCSLPDRCMEPVDVRCGCRRLKLQLQCSETNHTKNFRYPCDDTCAELKKMRTIQQKPSISIEEPNPIVENETKVEQRKVVRDTPSTPIMNSTKKVKPRRFIWTSNVVLALFMIFMIVILTLIILMLKEIS